MESLAAYGDDEDDATVASSSRTQVKAVSSDVSKDGTTGKHLSVGPRNKGSSASPASSSRLRTDDDEVVEGASPLRLDVAADDELLLLAPPSARRRKEDGTWAYDAEWGLPDERDTERAPDEALTAKLARFHELKKEGVHFNESLARNRSFHNPHIYAKLVEYAGIDERASAFPEMVGWTRSLGGEGNAAPQPDIDAIWPSSREARDALMAEGSAEQLAELQRQHVDQLERERADIARRGKMDFVKGGTEFAGERDAPSSRPSSRGPMPPVPRSGNDSGSSSYSYRDEVARRAQKIKDDLARGEARTSNREYTRREEKRPRR